MIVEPATNAEIAEGLQATRIKRAKANREAFIQFRAEIEALGGKVRVWNDEPFRVPGLPSLED